MSTEEELVIEYISQAKATGDDSESGELEWVYKVHWVGYPEDQASHEHDNGFFTELLDEFWAATDSDRDVKKHAKGTIIKPSQQYIGKHARKKAIPVGSNGDEGDSAAVEGVTKSGVHDLHMVSKDGASS
ncbi:hypothetical protein CALCODRAFT_557215 [Calocera cornea HHB12733]|uniref:Chromo domain-containing protein n=1 Tax=Calocera cornea HHB12733 TaxID=1353952 RepID=A0A165E2U0_9BASI|nr:hypothetical protein CALCODRAFT_557215 [Calocera cornea HHB12733]